MSRLKPMVFVVDDDASVRKALERLLKSVGMEVETYSGGVNKGK
jgi:FixJ family two-component response regulator